MHQKPHIVTIDKFVICSDVVLSGADIETLRAKYAELIMTASYNAEIPSQSFGRGCVTKITLSIGSSVMRLYRRGGFFSKFNKSTFHAFDFMSSRPAREFDILRILYAAGIKVSKPIAGLVRWNALGFYHAVLVTQEINNAINLLYLVEEKTPAHILFSYAYLAGVEAKKCLDSGILHTDLHPGNVLISNDRCYLIDFDKAQHFSENQYQSSQDHLIGRWNRGVMKRIQNENVSSSLIEGFGKGLGRE